MATDATLDERILGDAFVALEEGAAMERTGAGQRVWELITGSKIRRLAVVAVIILAALISLQVLTGPKETALEAEMRRIEAMAAAGDVEGLVAMLSEGEFASKVLAAEYLGQIGDERALPELERLYLLAEEHLPEDYTHNPFAEPIEKIKGRVEPERPESVVPPDIEDVTGSDVNQAGVKDVDKSKAQDTNEAGLADIATEHKSGLDFYVVHKETQEPMAGFKLDVKIQREGPDDVREVMTDAQGHYRIEIDEEETNYVLVEAKAELFVPMRVCWRKQDDLLEIPKSYRLALEPGTSIGGFVRDEEGVPIKAATLYLRASGAERSENEWVSIRDHEERTDANGFWHCDIVPAMPGYISIRLAHPDYMDDESYRARTTPPIRELRDMNSVMVMKKGVDVLGKVVDAEGRAIANASVRQGMENAGVRLWVDNPRDIEYPGTETDPEGIFVFRNTKPGRGFLTVQAKGYAPDFREIMVREGMGWLEFRLGPAQIIRGRVVNSKDEAIEAVEVSLDNWHGRKTLRWETETDANGYFEWNEAPKDEMQFAFSKEGYRPIRFLEMSPGPDEHIIVMYQALRVSGKVLDADSNEPISEFRLILGSESKEDRPIDWDRGTAQTFTAGRYELDLTGGAVPLEGCVIRVEADGYVPGISRTLTEEQKNVVIDFELEKGKGPSGTVYLPNGEPAVGAKLALSTPDGSVFLNNGQLRDDERWQSATTGTDGQFSFWPQTDRYVVVVVHDGGYAEVTDDELAAEPNVVLKPWGCVEGTFRIGGQPGIGEIVRLEYYSDERRYEYGPRIGVHYGPARVDANGHFVWARLAPGRVRISLWYRLGGVMATRTRSQVIEVVSGEWVSVTIGGRGRTVVGSFVSADPNVPIAWGGGQVILDLKLPEPPTPDNLEEMIFVEKRRWRDSWLRTEEGRAYKKMEWERGCSYRAKIERDGSFRVDDVMAGEYELRAGVGEKLGGKVVYGPRKPVAAPDYEFAVPDVYDQEGDKLLDLGTLEVEIKRSLGVGDLAPAFKAETFDGREIKPADCRGKAVVLTFWNSERPSTLVQLERIIQACRALGEQERLVMIGMSLDRDIEAAVSFVENNELRWINCYPSRGTRVRVSDDYQIWTFPSTFVIGPDGKILAQDPSPSLLQSILEEALGR
jgi:peroxiredoxin